MRLTGVQDSAFVENAQRLIDELEASLRRQRERLASLQQSVERGEHELATMREALRIYRSHYNLEEPSIQVDEAQRKRFAGMATREMLVELARENGGVVVGAEAVKALVRAGIFQSEANASSNVYAALSPERSHNLFKKIGRGKYQLLVTAGTDTTETLPTTASVSVEEEEPPTPLGPRSFLPPTNRMAERFSLPTRLEA